MEVIFSSHTVHKTMSGTYWLVLPSSTVQFRRILKFFKWHYPFKLPVPKKSESKLIENSKVQEKSDMLKNEIPRLY